MGSCLYGSGAQRPQIQNSQSSDPMFSKWQCPHPQSPDLVHKYYTDKKTPKPVLIEATLCGFSYLYRCSIIKKCLDPRNQFVFSTSSL